MPYPFPPSHAQLACQAIVRRAPQGRCAERVNFGFIATGKASDFRFGSRPDVGGPSADGPPLEVKRKERTETPGLPLEGPPPGGGAVVPTTWPEPPLLAEAVEKPFRGSETRDRLAFPIGQRHPAYGDAAGGSRPVHGHRTFGPPVRDDQGHAGFTAAGERPRPLLPFP